VRAAQSALVRREYVTDARLNFDNRRGIEVRQTCGRPGARMDWPEIWGVLLRAHSTQPVCTVPLAHKEQKSVRCKRSDNFEGGIAQAPPLMPLQRANHELGDQSKDGKRELELEVLAVGSCDVASIGLMQTKLPGGLALFCF